MCRGFIVMWFWVKLSPLWNTLIFVFFCWFMFGQINHVFASFPSPPPLLFSSPLIPLCSRGHPPPPPPTASSWRSVCGADGARSEPHSQLGCKGNKHTHQLTAVYSSQLSLSSGRSLECVSALVCVGVCVCFFMCWWVCGCLASLLMGHWKMCVSQSRWMGRRGMCSPALPLVLLLLLPLSFLSSTPSFAQGAIHIPESCEYFLLHRTHHTLESVCFFISSKYFQTVSSELTGLGSMREGVFPYLASLIISLLFEIKYQVSRFLL